MINALPFTLRVVPASEVNLIAAVVCPTIGTEPNLEIVPAVVPVTSVVQVLMVAFPEAETEQSPAEDVSPARAMRVAVLSSSFSSHTGR